MNVADLILKLQQFPPDMRVVIESSDGEYDPQFIHTIEQQTVSTYEHTSVNNWTGEAVVLIG